MVLAGVPGQGGGEFARLVGPGGRGEEVRVVRSGPGRRGGEVPQRPHHPPRGGPPRPGDQQRERDHARDAQRAGPPSGGAERRGTGRGAPRRGLQARRQAA